MKMFNSNSCSFLLILTFVSALLFTSCSNDDIEIELVKPTIENVEIGSGNNAIGIIGRDFHFEMDVVAGNLIDDVKVEIKARSNETYSQDWSFEISWDEYQGLKNTNVHKHFDIPEDGVVGIYDLIITVNDQNGTSQEETHTVKIIDPETLPVDPNLYIFLLEKVVDENSSFLQSFYANGDFSNPVDTTFTQNEKLRSYVQINDIKDDGVMYMLLIKKSLNHLPETVDQIDFSKVIVCDVHGHSNIKEVTYVDNYFEQDGTIRERPELVIGATEDNNIPNPNPISGDKAWESGTYYFGVVYTNSTHNLSLKYYIEFDIIF